MAPRKKPAIIEEPVRAVEEVEVAAVDFGNVDFGTDTPVLHGPALAFDICAACRAPILPTHKSHRTGDGRRAHNHPCPKE